MCGIAGYVGSFEPGLGGRMNAAQAHRGPDGRGTFEDPAAEVTLAHVRLAILDLTPAAAQPMHSPNGRFVLIFNGEIYNFVGFRRDLSARGYRFASTGDTEVLLCGLMEYGIDFVERLNGIFTFALWDRWDRNLWLARDQLGVKPLYYAQPRPGQLLFASEIKALYAHPELSREPDFDAIQQHLAYCHASDARTALKAVKRLQPGHWLRWSARDRSLEIMQYWQPPFETASDLPLKHSSRMNSTGIPSGQWEPGKISEVAPRQSRASSVGELRLLLQQATERQLISDVPLGSFLSGGIDSSLVTILASRQAPEDFQCYTITYPQADNLLDRAGDDLPHARALAHRLGLPLRVISLDPTVADLWPKLVYHLDEPIADPAAIASYLMCKLARENGSTVLLSGQGGDELFCGYPRYRVCHSTAWMWKIPSFGRRFLSSCGRMLPGAREGKVGAMLRRFRRACTGLCESPERQFLAYCANTPQEEIDQVLSPEFKHALNGHSFMDDCIEHMEAQNLSGLSRLQERDLSIYLPNHNLLYTDKTGMAVGVEVRVPLLDLKLVERVVRYPYEWQLRDMETKVLFRDAARGIVPQEIIDRPKAGLGAPYRKWLRYDLAEMWYDLTSEDTVRRRGWFDHKALQDARARSRAGKDDLYMMQWAVLTIELWARQFLDQNPSIPR